MNDDTTDNSKKKVGKRSKVAEETATNFGELLYNPNNRHMQPLNGSLVPAGELEHDDEEEEENAEQLADAENENENAEAETPQPLGVIGAPMPETDAIKGKSKIDTLMAVFRWKKYIILIAACVVGFFLMLLLGILGPVGEYAQSDYNSLCETEGTGTLLSFLTSWEGGEDEAHSCDDGAGYVGYDIGDGTVSIGSGMTNHVITSSLVSQYIKDKGWEQYFNKNSDSTYRVDVGLCVPKDIINDLKVLVLEETFAKPIDQAAAKYNVEFTQFQRDALTCFNYNLGAGHTEELVSAYASGSYEGLWNVMKNYVNACINGNCGPMDALKKRRKAEFALFVTGDYSDQGKFYSRSLSNYDDYNSEGVMYQRPVCIGDISTNYTNVTSNGLNDVLTGPLKDKLIEKGTTYLRFNEYILNNVIKAGVGTREGVVAAAVSLVGGLYENYSIRIPYTWAGQHGGYISGIRNPAGGEFFGVHPLWGSSISYYVHNSEINRTYYHYGPDCSGFVMWALHNGGMSTGYSTGNRTSLNGKRMGNPGDLMWQPGHIMLVVGVSDEEKKYYVAHAAGGDQGTKISTIGFSDSTSKIVNMDAFYANQGNRKYTDATKFSEAFKAGQIIE